MKSLFFKKKRSFPSLPGSGKETTDVSMDAYTIRTQGGVELGPLALEQVESLIKQGRVQPTSMIFTQNTNHWHLAASISAVRKLLRKYHPGQNSAINRIRQTDHGISKEEGNIRKSSISRPSGSKAKRRSAGEEFSISKSQPVVSPGIEFYTIRASDGVEYGPSTYEQVKELVKQGRVKATTMVFTRSTNRWHLAASGPEIRVLLRRDNPSQDSVLNRIRLMGNANPRDSAYALMAQGRISTIRVKRPFWKRLFFH